MFNSEARRAIEAVADTTHVPRDALHTVVDEIHCSASFMS